MVQALRIVLITQNIEHYEGKRIMKKYTNYANKADLQTLENMVDKWNTEGFVRTVKKADEIKEKVLTVNSSIVKAFYAEVMNAGSKADQIQSILGNFIIPITRVVFNQANDAEVKESQRVATFTGLMKAEKSFNLTLWDENIQTLRFLASGFTLKGLQADNEKVKKFQRVFSKRYKPNEKQTMFSKNRIEKALVDIVKLLGLKNNPINADINRIAGFTLKYSPKENDSIISPSQVEQQLMKTLQRIAFKLHYEHIDKWQDAKEESARKKAIKDAEKKQAEQVKKEQQRDAENANKK